jgi:hypothetical protein
MAFQVPPVNYAYRTRNGVWIDELSGNYCNHGDAIRFNCVTWPPSDFSLLDRFPKKHLWITRESVNPPVEPINSLLIIIIEMFAFKRY